MFNAYTIYFYLPLGCADKRKLRFVSSGKDKQLLLQIFKNE